VRLVLLPGMDGTGRLFEPLLGVLSPDQHATVIPYPLDRFLDYRELAELVRARLPRGSPYWLVAESFGGPIALRIAGARPDGLLGVVLVCSFAASPDLWANRLLGWLAGAWIFRLRPPAGLIRWLLVGRDAPAGLVAATLSALRLAPPGILASRLRMVLRARPGELRDPVGVPVLYLRGHDDRLLGGRGLRTMLALRPDTTVVEIDAPHLLLQARPREGLREIERFAGTCCPRHPGTIS
jgi:pimeloyl-[acyl-carrier protein] methyl ester esterase